MKTKIIIQKDGKMIFSFKLKEPKKSKFGETDIMLDTNKSLHFDNVVIGEFYRQYSSNEYKVNAISWHGFYEIVSDEMLNPPKIHIKVGKEKIDKLCHWGSINVEEPFAVPICSLYVPRKMDVNNLTSNTDDLNNEIKYEIIDIDEEKEKRIDFFVTPKNILASDVLQSILKYYYEISDVDTYNNRQVEFAILIEIKEKSQFIIIQFEDESGHSIICRIVGVQPNSVFSKKMDGTFLLLIHDPNGIYDRITDRQILQMDPNTEVISWKGMNILKADPNLIHNAENLKQKYEAEMKKKLLYKLSRMINV